MLIHGGRAKKNFSPSNIQGKRRKDFLKRKRKQVLTRLNLRTKVLFKHKVRYRKKGGRKGGRKGSGKETARISQGRSDLSQKI